MNNYKERKNTITRRLTVLLTAAVFVLGTCLCPSAGFAATEQNGDQNISSTGYVDIPEIKERLSVKEGEEPAYLKKKIKKLDASLPEVYDPREMSFYKGRVQVMDQGVTDTCWAYSTSSTAQIAYLRELDRTGQTIDDDYALSPLHFAKYFYNRTPYPYGFTKKDKNVPGADAFANGGNNYLSAQALAGWMGVYAANAPGVYDDRLTLQNATFLTDIEYYVGSTSIYNLDEELVKEAIQKNGAVTAGIFWDSYYLSSDTKSYFCDYYYDRYSVGSTNHAITIIGWDDTYPASKFKRTPAKDGAWIVQNSWGSNYHDNGYVYVSYDDYSMGGGIAFDMQPADAYDANYHYDGNASPEVYKRKTGGDTANVYTVKDDGKMHTLQAVGFTTWNEFKASYNIKVYRGVKSKPSSGTLVADFNVSTPCAGIYTFDFGDYGVEPVPLNTGEKFSVVIRATKVSMKEDAFFIGYEKNKKYYADAQHKKIWINFKTTSTKGKCFFRNSANGKWTDLYTKNKYASFRIKAFTTTVDKVSLTGADVSMPADNYAFTGSAVKPEPTVRLGDAILVKGTDYTVSYSNNKFPGRATATIKGTGLYKGSLTVEFAIGGVEGFTAVPYETGIDLSWNKSPSVDGYELYRNTNGTFKKIKTFKKSSKVSFTDTGLTPGTEYQYRIRSYKKTKKKTYYSPYLDILTVTTL